MRSSNSVQGLRTFLAGDATILKEMVEFYSGGCLIRGGLHLKKHALWFEDNGEPRRLEDQKLSGALVPSSKTSIEAKLRFIGTYDERIAQVQWSRRLVRYWTRKRYALGDLLGKMLRYSSEDRISMEEVVQHPCFTL